MAQVERILVKRLKFEDNFHWPIPEYHRALPVQRMITLGPPLLRRRITTTFLRHSQTTQATNPDLLVVKELFEQFEVGHLEDLLGDY